MLAQVIQPLVSVIVPVYNGESFLEEAIASILAQSYRNLEVLVVDDGSSDGSAEIVTGFPAVRYHYQPNQGQCAALNTGIRLARADYLAFLDQDDVWLPDKTTIQMQTMMAYPELAVVLCDAIFFLSPGLPPPSWARPAMLDGARPSYCMGAMLARRRLIERMGLFRCLQGLALDVDFFFRFKDAGAGAGATTGMAIASQVLLRRRIHDRNLSGNPLVGRHLLGAVRDSVHRQKEVKA